MPGQLGERLPGIIKKANELLWTCYNASVNDHQLDAPAGLIFPRYNRAAYTEVRVSEREVAFVFASLLNKESFRYAVEVPTKEVYQFKGVARHRCALTDLAIYAARGEIVEPDLLVEFKKGGITTEASGKKHIEKDIEKFLHETPSALWFHTLERVYSNTICGVLQVLGECIWEVFSNTDRPIYPKQIHFNICVLDRPLALSKTMKFDPENVRQEDLRGFFDFQYLVQNRTIRVLNANGWEIQQPVQ